MSIYIKIFFVFLLLFLSCSKTPVSTDNLPDDFTPEVTYNFSDYIHFDTSRTYVVADTKDGFYYKPEIFVYWEQVIGEPFIDVDSNGVYTAGVDIFVKSSDPNENMDLNHDGIYNGPNSIWQPGVPFDDINGDGLYQNGSDGMYTGSYSVGQPYFDMNNNGVWDSDFGYDCSIVQCSQSELGSIQLLSFQQVDTPFVYISDSGIFYQIPAGFFSHYEFSFIQTDEHSLGLYNSMFNSYNNRFALLGLLDSETIKNESYMYYDTIQGTATDYLDSLFIEIVLEDKLEFDDSLYSDLLKIKVTHYPIIPSLEKMVSIEFYFDKNFGFFAYFQDNYFSNGNYQFYFFDKVDKIPIVLKK